MFFKLHNAKHENSISSHACQQCDKVYVRQYHLQRHMKEVHGSQSKNQKYVFNLYSSYY